MIAINLLPDRKKLELKAKMKSRLYSGISLIAIVVAVVIPVILFTLLAAQRFRVENEEKKIEKAIAELRGIEELPRILTVQNQLAALSTVDDERLFYQDLFAAISQATPTNVTYSEIEISTDPQDADIETDQDGYISLAGSTDTILDVNRFSQALSNLEVSSLKDGEETPDTFNLFDNVTITEVETGSGQGVAYRIEAGFNVAILQKDTVNTVKVNNKTLPPPITPQFAPQEELDTETEVGNG